MNTIHLMLKNQKVIKNIEIDKIIQINFGLKLFDFKVIYTSGKN